MSYYPSLSFPLLLTGYLTYKKNLAPLKELGKAKNEDL